MSAASRMFGLGKRDKVEVDGNGVVQEVELKPQSINPMKLITQIMSNPEAINNMAAEIQKTMATAIAWAANTTEQNAQIIEQQKQIIALLEGKKNVRSNRKPGNSGDGSSDAANN